MSLTRAFEEFERLADLEPEARATALLALEAEDAGLAREVVALAGRGPPLFAPARSRRLEPGGRRAALARALGGPRSRGRRVPAADRRNLRRLSHGVAPRPRRHGRGLAGRARRRAVRAARRAQAAASAASDSDEVAAPLRCASARSSRGSTTPDIARLLDGGVADRRPALLRAGARRRRADHDVRAARARGVDRGASALSSRSATRSTPRTASLVVHRDLKPSNILVTATAR